MRVRLRLRVRVRLRLRVRVRLRVRLRLRLRFRVRVRDGLGTGLCCDIAIPNPGWSHQDGCYNKDEHTAGGVERWACASMVMCTLGMKYIRERKVGKRRQARCFSKAGSVSVRFTDSYIVPRARTVKYKLTYQVSEGCGWCGRGEFPARLGLALGLG